MRRLAVVVAAVLLLAAAWFAAVEVGLPAGGISRNDATALALRQVHSSTAPSLSWALPGLFAFFRDGATNAVSPWHRVVWAVRVTGTFQSSCGPASEPLIRRCPSPDHTETVLLDYVSGEFIMASIEP